MYPDVHSSTIPNIPWRKEGNRKDWYSNLRGGFKVKNDDNTRGNTYNPVRNFIFQISYETIGRVQMTFLRLLSLEAHQNFTYTCINSVAWYNSRTSKYDMSIKLLGENEQEFSHSRLKPQVILDGCKTRDSKSETVFEVRTKKLHQLPIIDFFPVDYGMPNQAFGFSVGSVCFK